MGWVYTEWPKEQLSVTAFWEVTMLEAQGTASAVTDLSRCFLLRSAKFPSATFHMHVVLWQLLET